MIYYERRIITSDLEIAMHYVATNSTVRKVAKDFNMSKTTVHKRLTEFLLAPHIDAKEVELALQVEAVLEENKSERHKRGGYATKQLYASMNKGQKVN